MMRVICLLLVSTFALKVTAQQYTKFNGYGFKADRIWADSISIQPNDTIRNKAARSIAVIGSTLYIANGTKWNAISGGGGGATDTTSLSDRIDAKVPYTGAIANVDLSTYNLTARDIIPTRRLQLGIAASSVGTARFLNDQNSFQSSLISNIPASNINIYLPTKSDTLAVKSDIALKSVGLTMPSAFSVANSPLTSNGTLAVTAIGTAAQYIRGDGQLATLPSNSSGGSSVVYYLNGSVAASVGTYFQMSKIAVLGAGTDFSKAGNGLISQFITDVADPNRLEIPAGNWNFEMYMSASSSGGTPAFYVELLKYDGTTFTSIASSSANPEAITGGTTIDLYVTALAIPQTTLLATDRLAIRVYIVNSTGGRTITMHTENSYLCEIITNFAGGVSALNGLTANTQYFAIGTSGTDFGISSATDTHTFNLPTASATNTGKLSSANWTTFNNKLSLSDTLTISTRAWRQKGLDSLAAIELNVSDTNVFSRKLIQTNRQTASYTLALTDLNKLVEINNASANTLTVPLNSSIAFAIGSKIDIVQYGAGQTTITPISGVTINSYLGALKIAGRYGACTLVKIGTNEWYCFGNLSN
jgi:hypothetical protein